MPSFLNEVFFVKSDNGAIKKDSSPVKYRKIYPIRLRSLDFKLQLINKCFIIINSFAKCDMIDSGSAIFA